MGSVELDFSKNYNMLILSTKTDLMSRIVGGELAKRGQFPWAVALQYRCLLGLPFSARKFNILGNRKGREDFTFCAQLLLSLEGHKINIGTLLDEKHTSKKTS